MTHPIESRVRHSAVGVSTSGTPTLGNAATHRGERSVHSSRHVKVSQPETVSQAHTFTAIRNWYSDAGLCDRCSAQAAYGHQHGFHAVHQPCNECLPIVARFAHAKGNLWRAGDYR